MATTSTSTSTGPAPHVTDSPATVADLLARLGDIPPARIRLQPPLGTATEADVLRVLDRENVPCELIDGALVEKAMGFPEAEIAGLILTFLNNFVLPRRLGIVAPPDGIIRLAPGLVRIPDVAFFSRDRFPDGKRPRVPVPDLAPDLAVEVLSIGNTPAEMARKLREYFAAGTRLVWLVDPRTRTVRVHTGPEAGQSVLHDTDSVLDGGAVLPGLALPVRDLFPADDI